MNLPDANNAAFDLYMDKVNDHLYDAVGLDSCSLPDYDFWSTFEAGIPAKAAAQDAIRAASTF